jgi:hypothetical protein
MGSVILWYLFSVHSKDIPEIIYLWKQNNSSGSSPLYYWLNFLSKLSRKHTHLFKWLRWVLTKLNYVFCSFFSNALHIYKQVRRKNNMWVNNYQDLWPEQTFKLLSSSLQMDIETWIR